MATTMYLLAALCVVPLASAMFIPRGDFNSPFEFSYDAPDRKFLHRNSLGQIQAYEYNQEQRFVRNPLGGISSYSVVELSDPDIYQNTVGGFGGLMGLGARRLGTRPMSPTGASNYAMGFPSTLNNYVSGFPLSMVL